MNALFIQRSVKSDVHPDTLANNLAHLPQLLKGSVAVTLKPSNVAQKDLYSDSPYQDGIYTYRITIALPEQHKLQEVRILEPRGDSEKPWGHRDNVIERTLDNLTQGQYCGLRIPEHKIEQVLFYTTIYGTRTWGNGVFQEVWIGDMMRQMLPDEIHNFRSRERQFRSRERQ